MVYLYLMGDAVTRRALKPILLDKPELAAALSESSWKKMTDVLTNSMGEELNASFGKDAVGKLLRELVAEAQKPDPQKARRKPQPHLRWRLTTRLWPI